jgi:hypothetical protein
MRCTVTEMETRVAVKGEAAALPFLRFERRLT